MRVSGDAAKVIEIESKRDGHACFTPDFTPGRKKAWRSCFRNFGGGESPRELRSQQPFFARFLCRFFCVGQRIDMIVKSL
jgi:hypothetical protein